MGEWLLSRDHEQTADLELALLTCKGDESAFAEIVQRYSPRVFRVVNRFFRERGRVEEMAQEVFLKAFTRLDSYKGLGSMEGWLTRIATNTCLNLLRSEKRRPELTFSDLTNDETDWLVEQLSDVTTENDRSVENRLVTSDLANRVLETLSPEDRFVLMQIDGEGASIKEVVKMTGWSQSKVKVQAFRARRRMRQAVERLLAGRTRSYSPGLEESRG
ncbi:MAG: RNA polymerase sigma factor [Pyrinomonadaceae bacterium]